MTIPTIPVHPEAETQNGRHSPVRLSFDGGEVVVAPKDYDLLLLCVEKAAELHRKAVDRDERARRFQSELLSPLYEWCHSREDEILACYLPIPGEHIQVYVVTKSKQFDFDLAEKVAALELGLARAGWRIGVMQLPDAGPESLTTFFDATKALQVYA